MNRENFPSPAARLRQLIRLCNDASFAFSIGADHLSDAFQRARFKAYAQDRETCAQELERHLRRQGETATDTPAASFDRGDWGALAAAVAADDGAAIQAECERRDQAALEACIELLDDPEIDREARATILSQYHAIQDEPAAPAA